MTKIHCLPLHHEHHERMQACGCHVTSRHVTSSHALPDATSGRWQGGSRNVGERSGDVACFQAFGLGHRLLSACLACSDAPFLRSRLFSCMLFGRFRQPPDGACGSGAIITIIFRFPASPAARFQKPAAVTAAAAEAAASRTWSNCSSARRCCCSSTPVRHRSHT